MISRRHTCVCLIFACMFVMKGCRQAENETIPVDADASAIALTKIGFASHPEDVQRLVNQLNPADRHHLRQKRSRFEALDRSEQRRLRDFHRGICDSPSGSDLYAVLHRYREWLATIPDAQRADLLELPSDQRIDEIRKIRQTQQASSFRIQAGDIAAADAMAVKGRGAIVVARRVADMGVDGAGGDKARPAGQQAQL